MFPNPQAALPLPARSSLEQYKKRAKELVKACRSGRPDAIRAWAGEWLHSRADDVAAFALTKLSADSGRCVLADAQFVIARSYGFASWPKFAAHVESLDRADDPVSAFEAAVDAIVSGDAATLGRMLRERPDLVHARSTREHDGTLLIYTSANGVEGYRQRSPKNAADIAAMLLRAGADVDATADVYHGKCTTLGLVATSEPPRIAGVQIPVIDVLLGHGARMDLPDMAGESHTLVDACLANGQPDAARHLADRGAPLDLIGAAGLGRVDVMPRFFGDYGGLTGATSAQRRTAFAFASGYGHENAVRFFLDRGVDVNAELKEHGEGHTALHIAAYHGHADVVSLLVARGARVDAIDRTWKTPPLKWALTGWARKDADPDACYEVVARLVRAGAEVTPDILDWENVRADSHMQAALKGTLQP